MQSATRALIPVDVFDAARSKDPRLGLVTVYRTLEKLEQIGLVQRLHREEGCQALLPAGVGHQHFLFCEGCREVVLFDGDDLEGLFSRVSQQSGFEIREHWLQLSGLCPDCG
jgi:Fe2+ or Zn2+ uptake regulation protein